MSCRQGTIRRQAEVDYPGWGGATQGPLEHMHHSLPIRYRLCKASGPIGCTECIVDLEKCCLGCHLATVFLL